jgi:hypothetical protein
LTDATREILAEFPSRSWRPNSRRLLLRGLPSVLRPGQVQRSSSDQERWKPPFTATFAGLSEACTLLRSPPSRGAFPLVADALDWTHALSYQAKGHGERIFWLASAAISAVAAVVLLAGGRWYGVVTAVVAVIGAVNALMGWLAHKGVDRSQSGLSRWKNRRPQSLD